MNRRRMRRLAVAVYVLNVLAMTWPVATQFSAARPLILGLPLSMAWPVIWILIGLVTLLLLDHVENGRGRP
ncbi:MAG: hypothetical protein AAFY29_16305 [Pseudomonadota bacterium]